MPADIHERLRNAVHPLDAIPAGTAWNHADLEGLLDPASATLDAAVLVGLVTRGDELRAILTRRTDALRQHAGQVSFPGGRMDPGDADPASTALREAHEEIGLAPGAATVLGYLDPLLTITGYRVVPVVALVPGDFVARPDAAEVADVFEVPLRDLLDPANLEAVELELRGRARRVLQFREFAPAPGQRIWGATASILLNLRERLEAVA